MGVDIFVQCFDRGEPSPVDTQAVIACFAPFVVAQDPKWLDLRFGPRDTTTVYLDTTEPFVDSFMVSRPCADGRLGECIYKALQLGSFAVITPGDDYVIVSSESAIADLPEDLLEDMKPEVPKSLEHFQSLFSRS